MRNTLMEMHSMKLKRSLSFSNKLRQTLQYKEYVTYSTRELIRLASTSEGAACIAQDAVSTSRHLHLFKVSALQAHLPHRSSIGKVALQTFDAL